jgi:hypothetical protein
MAAINDMMSDSDRELGASGAVEASKRMEEELEGQLEEVDPLAEGKLVRESPDANCISRGYQTATCLYSHQ